MDLKNRYLGTLIGVHVGDSLGAPYETWGPKRIAQDIEARGGLTLFDYENPWKEDGNGETLPAGRPTDDSDQTAALADSLINFKEIVPNDLRRNLRQSVVHGKSLLWGGKATGAGSTTRKALSENPEDITEARANIIGTNGSLMRCSPMALWFGPFPPVRSAFDWLYGQVRSMSIVTHTHPHCIESCWVYVNVLTQLLRDNPYWRDGLATSDAYVVKRVRLRLDDANDFPYDPGAWPARGTAEFSLYVALYALQNAQSFAEGIELAIRVGGDTDTNAAIAGGLLGAKYGYEEIPPAWREGILGHNAMVRFAEDLYDMKLT
jgi:ADP-ribosyl-[dinitrogen reductase] hydrolase